MTQPYGPPHPPPPYAGPPRRARRRPSGWWFLLPVVGMVLGGALVVGGFVSTLGPLADEYAVVGANGGAEVVTLDDSGELLLMGPEGQPPPECGARDPDSGDVLSVDRPGASYTFTNGSRSWVGLGVVDPPGTSVELSCDGGSEVRVSASPGGPGALLGGIGTILVGAGLGVLGFVGLVVLAILYATGAPRRTTTDG